MGVEVRDAVCAGLVRRIDVKRDSKLGYDINLTGEKYCGINCNNYICGLS